MDTTIPTIPVSTPVVPMNTLGGLNIDQMLGSLGQKSDKSVTPVISSTQSTPLGTTFSIDAMTKPTLQQDIELPTKEQSLQLSGQTNRFSLVMKSPAMRSVAALFGTVFLVMGGLWFMSVQYPIEAENYKTQILGLFSATTQLVQNNLSGTGIISTGTNILAEKANDLTVHSSAPVYDDSTPTPLADALAGQQSSDQQPTSTEQTWDTALATSDTGTTLLSDTGAQATIQDNVLGGVDTALADPVAQKAQLIQDVTAIKSTADSYLTQATASNKGTIARVISKNADAILAKLETAPASDYESISKEINQLKGLIQKIQ